MGVGVAVGVTVGVAVGVVVGDAIGVVVGVPVCVDSAIVAEHETLFPLSVALQNQITGPSNAGKFGVSGLGVPTSQSSMTYLVAEGG